MLYKKNTEKQNETDNGPICIEQMTFPKPLGPNGTVIIIFSGKAGRTKKTPRPQTFMELFDKLANIDDLGSHLATTGFWRGSPNRPFLKNIEQKRRRKWGPRNGLEKTWLFIDFWCQNGKPEIVQKRCSHYTCCKIWVCWESWNIEKFDAKTDSENDNKRITLGASGRIFEFGSVFEKYDLLMICDWPKNGPTNQNNLKKQLRGDVRDQMRPAEPMPRRR